MERLDFSKNTNYNAIEAAIHLNRYSVAKSFCPGAVVLDAACGEGYGSYLMKMWGAKSVEGVDVDEKTIELASSLFKDDDLHYSKQNVQDLPYADNTFDLIVSLETIEHVDDASKFLKEIKRVLKPSGVVILSCPNDKYYYEKDNIVNPFHKKQYTFFDFKELAEKNLGSYVEYYLGFALDGFINLPFQRRTEPEYSIKEDAMGMFHYTECDQTLCVPQERYLNQWNCNYYLGIWGKTDRNSKYNAVIAPREMFIDHKDKDYDLLFHLDQIKQENEELKEELKTEKAKARDESSWVELDRIKMLLELTTKEKNQATQQIGYFQNALDSANQQLEAMRNSKCFRILKKFDKVVAAIRGQRLE